MKRRNDGIDVQGKRPCFEFYPADWIRDLAPCSPVAKGVWVDFLCHMHFARRRGYLETPAGTPFSEAQLARMTGTTGRGLKSALEELKACGIYSLDESGVIFNRRMVRDTDISRKRASAAKERLQGAERTDAGTFAPAKEPAKAEQKTVPSSSPSLSSSSSPSGSKTALTIEDGFSEFRTAFEGYGLKASETDWQQAHAFEWKRLDFEQKLAAVKGIRDRVEAGAVDDPAASCLPKNYLAKRMWERGIRGPIAKRDRHETHDERVAESFRELMTERVSR